MAKPLSNSDFTDVVLQQGLTRGSNVPRSFHPIRPTQPVASVSDGVQLGNQTGVGNGAMGVAVTTTAQGSGSGPTTPQTIVAYLKVHVGNQIFWLPMVQ